MLVYQRVLHIIIIINITITIFTVVTIITTIVLFSSWSKAKFIIYKLHTSVN